MSERKLLPPETEHNSDSGFKMAACYTRSDPVVDRRHLRGTRHMSRFTNIQNKLNNLLKVPDPFELMKNVVIEEDSDWLDISSLSAESYSCVEKGSCRKQKKSMFATDGSGGQVAYRKLRRGRGDGDSDDENMKRVQFIAPKENVDKKIKHKLGIAKRIRTYLNLKRSSPKPCPLLKTLFASPISPSSIPNQDQLVQSAAGQNRNIEALRSRKLSSQPPNTPKVNIANNGHAPLTRTRSRSLPMTLVEATQLPHTSPACHTHRNLDFTEERTIDTKEKSIHVEFVHQLSMDLKSTKDTYTDNDKQTIKDATDVSILGTDEVLVTDVLSNTVTLYGEKGSPRAVFTLEAGSEPRASCVTLEGGVAVTLKSRGCVAVWSSEGNHVMDFGKEHLLAPTGELNIRKPFGLDYSFLRAHSAITIGML